MAVSVLASGTVGIHASEENRQYCSTRAGGGDTSITEAGNKESTME